MAERRRHLETHQPTLAAWIVAAIAFFTIVWWGGVPLLVFGIHRKDIDEFNIATLALLAIWLPLWIALSIWVAVKTYRAVLKNNQSYYWRKAGRCTNCGYDLRASRAGVSCPECGKVIEVDRNVEHR